MAGDPNVKVKFTADGLDGVRKGLKLVKDEAEPTGRQWGVASRQIAGGLESIARQGKVTGESLKQIVNIGSDIAFAFGATGAVVGAITLTGVAIFEHITGNMKAAREETRKFQEEIAGFRRGDNLLGAGRRASDLYSGERFAVQRDGESPEEFEARSLGVQGLRTKVDILKNRPQFGLFGNPDQQKDLQTYTALLAKYEEQAQAAADAVAALAAAEGERVKVGAGIIRANQRPGVSRIQDQMLIGGGGGLTRFLDDIVRAQPLGKPAPGSLTGFSIKGAKRPEDNPATKAMVDTMKQVAEIAGKGFVDTLADTIEAGIARVFAKGATVGNVFAAIGETALAGLGSIASQIGRAALTQFAFIKTISSALAGLNPALGIPAAIALIAFGGALGGAGHRIGANASGGGGGGYGSSYSSSAGYGGAIIDRGTIDPTRGSVNARQAITNHIVVIGPNDPIAQRQLEELLKNGRARGGIGG